MAPSFGHCQLCIFSCQTLYFYFAKHSCNHFETLENVGDIASVVRCARCERIMTREELIELNSENIHSHVEEISHQAVKDAQKMFRKAFKGSKNIKIR